MAAPILQIHGYCPVSYKTSSQHETAPARPPEVTVLSKPQSEAAAPSPNKPKKHYDSLITVLFCLQRAAVGAVLGVVLGTLIDEFFNFEFKLAGILTIIFAIMIAVITKRPAKN